MRMSRRPGMFVSWAVMSTSSKNRVFWSRFLLIFIRTLSKTSPGPRMSSRMMTTLFVLVLPSIWIDSMLNFSLSSTTYSRSMSFVLRLGLRVTWTRVLEVPVLAVVVLEPLDRLVDLRRREHRAGLRVERRHALEERGRMELVARDRDLADLVLAALLDRYGDDEAASASGS